MHDPSPPGAGAPHPQGSPTPDIRHLLKQQQARVRGRFLIHGTGYVIAAAFAVMVIYYTLDRALSLPPLVRVVLSLGVLVYLAAVLRRRVLYPMRRDFGELDVAMALERRFPELRQQLVTALQLTPDSIDAAGRSDVSRAMAAEVARQAGATAAALPLKDLLNPRRTQRVWGVALAVLAITGTGAYLDGEAVGVFTQRIFGIDASYPRETTLVIELPSDDPDLRVAQEGGVTKVTLAGGADLPVIVRALGKVPDVISLSLTTPGGDTRTQAMAPRGEDRFRYVFRRVSRGFRFQPQGGDDDGAGRVVEVEVIEPPRVAQVRAVLTPPAYTGQPTQTLAGGAVEGLVGTQVQILVAPTKDVDTAVLAFRESGLEVPLEPEEITTDDGTKTWYSGKFTVQDTDRYQVQLTGENGLRNANPGSWPVLALVDHGPVGRLLTPSRDGISVYLPGAVMPVRAELRDDYGLASATLEVLTRGSDTPVSLPLALPATAPDAPPTTRAVVLRLFELQEVLPQLVSTIEGATETSREGPAFAPADRVEGGVDLDLSLAVTDNMVPEAHSTELNSRPVSLVNGSQLAAAIGRHFRSIREEVSAAAELQGERKARLQVLADGGLDTQDGESSTTAVLTALQIGQGRVRNLVRSAHRKLMHAFDAHLFNRLETAPAAVKVLEQYRIYYAASDSADPVLAGFYRELSAARAEGRLGAMETTLDPILLMIQECDTLVSGPCQDLLDTLARAQVAATGEDRDRDVQTAAKLAEAIHQRLVDLLGRLDEWNDFQDVVQEARALKEKQRDIQLRTRELQGGR